MMCTGCGSAIHALPRLQELPMVHGTWLVASSYLAALAARRIDWRVLTAQTGRITDSGTSDCPAGGAVGRVDQGTDRGLR